MKSVLSLQVYESGDCNSLMLKDTSTYNSDITTTCAQLLITPPGFGDTHVFDVEEDFFVIYNSYDFLYTNAHCDDEPIPLQDGIYQIRYQICPTAELYVEYNHLRQCEVLNCYNQALCAVKLEACTPNSTQVAKLEKLKEIKQLLDAAKAYVEVCNSPEKGLELHNYAIKRLTALNLTCDTCN